MAVSASMHMLPPSIGERPRAKAKPLTLPVLPQAVGRCPQVFQF